MEVDFRSQLYIDEYGEGFPCRQQTLVTYQPIRRFFGSVLSNTSTDNKLYLRDNSYEITFQADELV